MEQMSPSSKIRRLSIQNAKEDDSIILAYRSLDQVRSIIVLQSATNLIPVLRSFQVLRVMHLQNCDLSHGYNLSKCLGNLFHLRYLGLRNTCIVELPQEIGNLQFLQIPDICEPKISSLPSNVLQLEHLMCLDIDSLTRVPNGIGRLTSLERLSLLWVDESNMDNIEELGQLMELRVLVISLDEWNDKLVESLRNLQKIQDLTIWGPGGGPTGLLDAWVAPRHLCSSNTIQGSWFSELPTWMNPSHLPCLTSLSIAIRKVQPHDLDILGNFHALRYLALFVGEYLGMLGEFVVGAGSFACLLCCGFCGFGRPIVFQQGAMPRLRFLRYTRLSVRGAIEMRSNDGVGVDLGLGLLPSLQQIQVLLDDEGASKEEAKELKAMLCHATKIHPNRPKLWIDGDSIQSESSEPMPFPR